MLRLFGIKEMTGAELLIPDLYFSNKQDAKKERRTRNTRKDEEGNEILDFVVTRGPDHMDGLARHSSFRTAPGRKGTKRGAKIKPFMK